MAFTGTGLSVTAPAGVTVVQGGVASQAGDRIQNDRRFSGNLTVMQAQPQQLELPRFYLVLRSDTGTDVSTCEARNVTLGNQQTTANCFTFKNMCGSTGTYNGTGAQATCTCGGRTITVTDFGNLPVGRPVCGTAGAQTTPQPLQAGQAPDAPRPKINLP